MDTDYAVIQLNSRQFIVKNNSLLKVDRITTESPVKVLLTSVEDKLVIGEPYVESAGVTLEILEQKKDKKINVSRFRNKSRYRKHKGFRQPISLIKVVSINSTGAVKIIDKTEKEDRPASTVKTQPKQEPRKGEEVKIDKVETDKKISELDLSENAIKNLSEAGYKTISDLKKAKKEDLLAIKGFGEKAVDKILKSI